MGLVRGQAPTSYLHAVGLHDGPSVDERLEKEEELMNRPETILTKKELEALTQLRENAEDYPDRDGFSQVYLDNCPMSADRRTWSAVLGSLTKKGLYRPQGDGCFGDVLVE